MVYAGRDEESQKKENAGALRVLAKFLCPRPFLHLRGRGALRCAVLF